MDPIALYQNNMDKAVLSYTDGMVYSWNDFNLPKKIDEPLIMDPMIETDVLGIRSGERSALLNIEKEWYKLKGCNYMPLMNRHPSGEPWGAMSEKNCENELEMMNKMHGKYSEFGLEGPMEPVGKIEYDMYFDNNPVYCSISKVMGETRLGRCFGRLTTRPPKVKDKYFKTLLPQVSQWLGFDQYLLQEAGISIPIETFDINNYLVWDAGDGYAISRVDLSSAVKTDKNCDKKKIEFDIDNMHSYGTTFALYPVAKKVGLEPARLMQGIDEKHRGIALEMVKSQSEECEVKSEKDLLKSIGVFAPLYSDADPLTSMEVRDRLIRVSENRFKWADKLTEKYRFGLEGNQPEPIDKKYFDVIFNRN
ncbi:MAG: hypothetical protein GOV02_03320 [Candidatus Aenigmarchaeota archaeon]|nr:hypothetical protein [Candidatus Aenigmarchaeota archaeon]